MTQVLSGLDRLAQESEIQQLVKGNIGLLCHSASLTRNYVTAPEIVSKIFGQRFIKLFGPQHGFVCDVQDNMIETDDFHHPFFNVPVHSLYGETRIPTDKMLEGIDTLIIDLQDVGTRVYTYISTLGLLLEKIKDTGIRALILDRPNPAGGELIEGNILDSDFHSFVGHHNIPMRHAMTMGEVAKWTQKYHSLEDVDIQIIKCAGWKRSDLYADLNFPWVNPSPNLSTINSLYAFCGSVLFEGCNISEGRGTTRALEVIGAPGIEPYQFTKELLAYLEPIKFKGLKLRPVSFYPMFQKHKEKSCGGVHIHVTKAAAAKTWKLGQHIMKFLYHKLGDDFKWNDKPYEYQSDRLAIDFINGTDKIREWIEANGSDKELEEICNASGLERFKEQRQSCLLY